MWKPANFKISTKFYFLIGVYPGVIMTVLLRRKISYHLLQTYLPSGLFVIVAWLSLFLPPQSIPGRVTMAMTTLLTLAAMFGAVRYVVFRKYLFIFDFTLIEARTSGRLFRH